MKLKWMNIWLNKYEKAVLKLRTYCKYEQTINLHICQILGEYNLLELTPQVLQDFVILQIEKGNLATGNGLAISTVRNMVALLKRALKKAVQLGEVDKEFTDSIVMPRGAVKQVSAFEKKDQKILEDYCLNHHKKNYLGIVICLYTGIRLGELLALEWGDIDFNKKIMSINKTAYRVNYNHKRILVIDKPKTQNSNRAIPLSRVLISILKRLKRLSHSQFVLENCKNERLDERSYQRTFKAILKRIGVPYRNFHALRHTFATRALELGVDIKTVSELLGHKNLNITLSTYAHSMFTYKIEVMNKLSNSLMLEKDEQIEVKQGLLAKAVNI